MLKHLRIIHREWIKYFLNFGLSWMIIIVNEERFVVVVDVGIAVVVVEEI